MQTQLSPDPIPYDGKQLRKGWIRETFQINGDALVAFEGPADVPIENMVDLEDVKNNAPIYSPRMLHFIAEWHKDGLRSAILLQHLFTGNMYQMLWERGIGELHRRGNDLYYQKRKLSVSIATRSNTTVLMHAAVNIETEGTPVPTAGLKELSIDSKEFALSALQRFQTDFEGWDRCLTKVRPV